MTTTFIIKAKEVHGDKYNYSLIVYKNVDTKVTIICKEHGEFLQTPYCHLKGQGCKKCGFIRSSEKQKHTKESFIVKAKEVHRDTYDYSKVIYINNRTKVIIICNNHGIFEQMPSSHLVGRGCNLCANIVRSEQRKDTKESFIEKAKEVHGDTYDYSKVIYIKSSSKINIICNNHGIFEQNPNDHLSGYGCKLCGIIRSAESKKDTKESFIEKAKEVHGDKYNYSLVNYINNTTPIKIICKNHGEFIQTPNIHLSGCGCQLCVDKGGSQRYDTEKFIKIAKQVHGDIYDYSKVDYINSLTKVNIICKKHGIFDQQPSSHLNGSGCSKCYSKYSKQQIEWLDLQSKIHHVHIQHAMNDTEYTIPTTKLKADGYCKETNTVYEFHGDFWHGNPKLYNSEGINKVNKISFGELYTKTLEREQQIKSLGYNLVVLWEYDWNKLIKSVRYLQLRFKKYKITNDNA